MERSIVRGLSLVVCGLLMCWSAGAQENKHLSMEEFYLDPTLYEMVSPRHGYRVMEGGFPTKNIDSTVDVLSYELWFDWVMALQTARSLRPERKAEAKVVMQVRFTEGKPSVTLDARTVIIDSVFVDGVASEFEKTLSVLTVTPPSPFLGNDTAVITIHFANASDTRGFYAYSQVEVDTLGLPEPIAFTFSQPEDARRWFPCNDKPHDKALFTVHTRVPTGYTVVSNGTRQDSTADSDTTSWQTWHHPLPMSTYLFCVNASKYHRYDQQYVRDNNSTVPIENYHWLEDHLGEKYNAEKALAEIPNMFGAFEEKFGTYPWPTYGHVTVAPIPFGGMEHQSMSTINRRWLEGDIELGYAHELGHQWIGDEVTCATWADIWLNEGGASFSEALWYEAKIGPTGYASVMEARRQRYLRRGLDEPPVYDIPIGILFNEATTYSKSAWVYHMMRRQNGDSLFFPALRSYIAKYHLAAAQTADMLAHFKQEMPNPPVDWDTFFDQWLVQAGHPVLNGIVSANTIPENGSYRTRVTLSQLQSGENIPSDFQFPLTIRLISDTNVFTTSLMVTEQTTTATFMVPFIADSLEIDPNEDLLCQKTAFVFTSVDEEEAEAASHYLGANPLRRGDAARFSVPVGATVHVTDVTGRTLHVETAASSVIELDTSSWPIGAVAIRVNSMAHRLLIGG